MNAEIELALRAALDRAADTASFLKKAQGAVDTDGTLHRGKVGLAFYHAAESAKLIQRLIDGGTDEPAPTLDEHIALAKAKLTKTEVPTADEMPLQFAGKPLQNDDFESRGSERPENAVGESGGVDFLTKGTS
jgi:hypothetical protein